MIGFYPQHYNDECLYSGVARFSEITPFLSKKQLIKTLFNDKNLIAVVDLPSHIGDMVANLPFGHNLTGEKIINESTLLPYYAPFLPPERYEVINKDMLGRNGPAVQMRIGAMASTVTKPDFIRYCPDCVKKDRSIHYKTYWHRLHQIPGILVCPEHHVFLENSLIPLRNRRIRYEFISAERAGLSTNSRSAYQHPKWEHLTKLAEGAKWLLENPKTSIGLDNLRKKYKAILFDSGYANYSGRLFARDLVHDFKEFLSDDVLFSLGCQICNEEENWLLRLLRGKNSIHDPLHHLLLLSFVKKSVEELFEQSPLEEPFGSGPWSCLNPACSHNQKPVIEHYQTRSSKYTEGRPISVFSCNCGFQYTKNVLDNSIRVLTFGRVWENELTKLWDSSLSLRSIAKSLAVDPRTVKRYGNKLGLAFPRSKSKNQSFTDAEVLHGTSHTDVTDNSQILEHRKQWLLILNQNSTFSVTQIRRIMPKIYTWLYRHDKDWLLENYPVNRIPNSRENDRVNWEERDLELTQLVILATERIKSIQGKPVYLSKTTVAKETGQYAVIQQHSDKLPRTIEMLQTLTETREDYAIRRIQWVINQFQKDEVVPEKWELIRRAGVNRYLSSQKVNDALSLYY